MNKFLGFIGLLLFGAVALLVLAVLVRLSSCSEPVSIFEKLQNKAIKAAKP